MRTQETKWPSSGSRRVVWDRRLGRTFARGRAKYVVTDIATDAGVAAPKIRDSGDKAIFGQQLMP